MEEISRNISDTSPEAREFMLERMRTLSPSEKLRKISALYRSGLALIAATILSDNPLISKSELRRELAIRVYGKTFVEQHDKAFQVEPA